MKCPICFSTESALWSISSDFEYQTTDDTYCYLECKCGVIFLKNPPIDQIRAIYPSSYYSYRPERSGLIFRIKRKSDIYRFRKFLSTVSAPQLNVLDVGGGNGEVCNAIRDADRRVISTTIVDLDPQLEEYHRKTDHEYVCTNIEGFITKTSFNIVTLINLIEHVENPKAILGKIREILCDDGLIIIQTPNTNSLDARLFRRSHWGGLHAPRHWVLFNRVNLEKVLTETGFSNVSIRYSQGAPFWAVSAVFQLQKLRILRQSKEPVPLRRSFALLLIVFALTDSFRAKLGFKTSQMYVTARATP